MNIYITEGPEAALEQLAIDGAIAIGTAGVGAAAYKTYKVGKTFFTNADDAYIAAAKQLNLPSISSATLSTNAVQTAIKDNLNTVIKNLPEGQYNGIVHVDGIKLDYSAYKLPDGTINVGRITPPRQ